MKLPCEPRHRNDDRKDGLPAPGSPPDGRGRAASLTARRSTAARGATAAALAALAGCAAVVDEERGATFAGRVEVADKFVHRGMPQNRNWVAQGAVDTTLPTEWGDSLTIGAFANMDLKSSTGAAWFPGGHGGRISQFELTGTYAHTFENGLTLAGGIHNYNVPFGESFPNGPRESTNELFVIGEIEVLDARPELQIRHDFDQANGTYVRLGIGEEFPVGEQVGLELRSHLGWSSASQSLWNYGLDESGFADLQASATVFYDYDPHTRIGASLTGSTIVDSDLRDWFELIGIESDNLWIGVFVVWTY